MDIASKTKGAVATERLLYIFSAFHKAEQIWVITFSRELWNTFQLCSAWWWVSFDLVLNKRNARLPGHGDCKDWIYVFLFLERTLKCKFHNSSLSRKQCGYVYSLGWEAKDPLCYYFRLYVDWRLDGFNGLQLDWAVNWLLSELQIFGLPFLR